MSLSLRAAGPRNSTSFFLEMCSEVAAEGSAPLQPPPRLEARVFGEGKNEIPGSSGKSH